MAKRFALRTWQWWCTATAVAARSASLNGSQVSAQSQFATVENTTIRTMSLRSRIFMSKRSCAV